MFCTNCGSQLGEDGTCSKCANASASGKSVRVVITRPSSFFGIAVKFKVFIDGNEVGKLANNSSIEVMLPSGVHSVTFDMWSASDAHQITIPDNCNTFYIDTKLKMGLITNSIAITSTRCE